MKLNLRQKLEKLSEIAFAILGVTASKTKDGEFVAILQLAEPIEYVRGSQELEFNGRKVPLEAFNVTEVKCHEADIDEAGDDFEFSEEGTSGSYKGTKLILDVAKSGQVWLRKDSFAAAGSEMRRSNQESRVHKLIEATLERQKAAGKTQPTGNAAPNPTLVDTTAQNAGNTGGQGGNRRQGAGAGATS